MRFFFSFYVFHAAGTDRRQKSIYERGESDAANYATKYGRKFADSFNEENMKHDFSSENSEGDFHFLT